MTTAPRRARPRRRGAVRRAGRRPAWCRRRHDAAALRQDARRRQDPDVVDAQPLQPRRRGPRLSARIGSPHRRRQLAVSTSSSRSSPPSSSCLVDDPVDSDRSPAHHDARVVAMAPAWPAPRGASGATPIGGRCPRRRGPGAGQAARTTGTRLAARSTAASRWSSTVCTDRGSTPGQRPAPERQGRAVRGATSRTRTPLCVWLVCALASRPRLCDDPAPARARGQPAAAADARRRRGAYRSTAELAPDLHDRADTGRRRSRRLRTSPPSPRLRPAAPRSAVGRQAARTRPRCRTRGGGAQPLVLCTCCPSPIPIAGRTPRCAHTA